MANVRDRMFDSLVVRARLYRSARMQHPHRRAVGCALMALTLLGCETVDPGRSGGGSARVEIVARLTATSPGVRIERSGQPMPYTPNMVVREGDRIRTGSSTYAAIDFDDGNTVYMNHDTWVTVGSIRVLLGEIFPSRIRGKALGVAAGAQWIANFLITVSFPAMSSWSLPLTYGMYATFAALSFFYVLFKIPETKGMELEKTETLFHKPTKAKAQG